MNNQSEISTDRSAIRKMAMPPNLPAIYDDGGEPIALPCDCDVVIEPAGRKMTAAQWNMTSGWNEHTKRRADDRIVPNTSLVTYVHTLDGVEQRIAWFYAWGTLDIH